MIQDFSNEKNKIIEKLTDLNTNLTKIENKYGLKSFDDIKDKISKSISSINKEKFSLAFFGSFSDGKSTILSSLIKNLDIKISPEPTTSTINTYEYKDWFIIDTPGLFSENMEHDELTKRYISEANIVIYTVDPVNPLKETHHPTVKWILEDIDKMKSTIFVVNKMDEVADLEDEDDFNKNADIKKKVVIDTLKNIVLSKDNPVVTCVAADPYTQGLNEWLKNYEEYRKLSRMGFLETEIKKFIEESREKLIITAGESVLKDSIRTVLDILIENNKELDIQIDNTSNQLKEIGDDLLSFNKLLVRKFNAIKEEVMNLRQDTMIYIQSSIDVADLRNKINTKIGKDAFVLNEKINTIVDKHTNDLNDSEAEMLRDIETSLQYHIKNQDLLIQNFTNVGSSLGEAILSNSKKELTKVMKDVGKLIGKKGWAGRKWASQWAGHLATFGKFLKALPLLTESLSVIGSMYNEYKFSSEKNSIILKIDNLFDSFVKDFKEETYKNSFENIKEIENNKDILVKNKENLLSLRQNTEETIKELEKILL